jgi:hypothetical protein
MDDETPISYLALTNGTPVVSTAGTEFGTVEHVLQDDALDFFDGLVVRTHEGRRFVDADQVQTITPSRVHTSVEDDQVAQLPQPDGSAVLEADPDEYDGNGLSAWFGRMFLREHWMRDRSQ